MQIETLPGEVLTEIGDGLHSLQVGEVEVLIDEEDGPETIARMLHIARLSGAIKLSNAAKEEAARHPDVPF